MRLGDKLLVLVLVFIIVLSLWYNYQIKQREGELIVEISMNGQVMLNEFMKDIKDDDLTFEWDGHYNTVRVTSEGIHVIAANCSNQQCVKQGKIDSAGQSIICLPNHFVITVKHKTESDIDYIIK